MGRDIAFANEMGSGVELADADGDIEHRPAVVVAQRRVGLKLADEGLERVPVLDDLAPAGGGRERLLSLSRRRPEVSVRQ
jgi:hypothetical protein